MPATWKFVLMLTVSNIFMNFAWYGHLKFKHSPVWIAILASWGLALFEYMFMVPGNRAGAMTLSLTQMKIAQECITLVVFVVFAYFMFDERLRWNHLAAFACLLGAVAFAFADKR
ncbi:DMT family protein [Lysobacter sp. HDW10]|uniref:DMT family protein n=1 Tax=Lysobacter sp. HDW10 TaxID=2714936 RepID=UPI00140AB119|nr:DMT family protein [Lysobacter sp. HDW10]QIK81971.1 DMT family protein [Lysobacter sp. HDW10]